MNTKNIEQRLRYALKKQGYYLIKSRSHNWQEQGYRIIDNNNVIVAGSDFPLSLDDVVAFINE